MESKIDISVKHALIGVFTLGILVGFVGGILAPTTLSNNFDTTKNTGQAANHDTTPSVDKIDLENEPVLGNENASVTLVMYEDFQCPYCRVFEKRTFGQIKSNFVDSGEVKIVWKDLPLESLGHDWAVSASETMECVYRQDNEAFWNVKSTLFENQKSVTSDNVQSNIIRWASNEGVSESAINTCLEDSSVSKEVKKDMEEARSFDTEYESARGWTSFISGTPSFVIFGEGDEEASQMVGAQPYSTFQNTIESKKEG